MELQRISLEDIYPDENNPRSDFGDIDALAESFELNTLNQGEPINPIAVVRDGGIFRIVDGERRYRAMKKSRLDECEAVVFEDMDEAEAQIAMLTTNDKQPLTELEISRGVQRQLFLGVDPVIVEKSARMKSGSASRVSKARLLVDDAAEDMTLDRLLAIEELADIPEAVEELTNCREGGWYVAHRKWLSFKENNAVFKAVTNACESLGLELAAKEPKGAELLKTFFNINEKNAEAVLSGYAANSPINSFMIVMNEPDLEYSYKFNISAFTKPKTVSDAEAEAIKSDNALKKAMTADRKRRAQFVGQRLAESGTKNLLNTCLFFKRYIKKDCSYELTDFLNKADIEIENVSHEVNDWMLARFFLSIDNMTQSELIDISRNEKERTYSDLKRVASQYVDLFTALQKDGYERSAAEGDLKEHASKHISKKKEEADNG